MSFTINKLANAIEIVFVDQAKGRPILPLASMAVFPDVQGGGVFIFSEGRSIELSRAEISAAGYANQAALIDAVKALQVQSVGGLMGEPVEVTVIRPADTTAYAANDVISSATSNPAAIIFDLAAAGVPAGGSGYLVKARLLTNNNAVTPRLRVHLYRTAPAQVNDNAAFPLLWANRSNRIGFIDFPALGTGGAGSDASNALIADLRFAFKLSAGETRLWAIIQTLDAFNPSSGQQFFFSFLIDRN